jgi:hypothetical protein
VEVPLSREVDAVRGCEFIRISVIEIASSDSDNKFIFTLPYFVLKYEKRIDQMGIEDFIKKSEARVAELKKEKSKPKVSPIQELLSDKAVRKQITKILKVAKQREAIATINELMEESGLLPEINTGRYKGQKKKITVADLKKAGIIKSK